MLSITDVLKWDIGYIQDVVERTWDLESVDRPKFQSLSVGL